MYRYLDVNISNIINSDRNMDLCVLDLGFAAIIVEIVSFKFNKDPKQIIIGTAIIKAAILTSVIVFPVGENNWQ